MFVKAIKDNKSLREGCYCSLVESYADNGCIKHRTIMNFGFMPFERVPFIKAAFNAGDPDEILAKEKEAVQELQAQVRQQASTRVLKKRGRKPKSQGKDKGQDPDEAQEQ